MKSRYSFFALALAIIISFITSIQSYEQNTFYRASSFFGEPRFEKPWLGTAEFNVHYGKTTKSINSNGHKRPLFDAWGLHNMQQLSCNAPNLDPSNPADAALIALKNLPTRSCFGFLSIHGQLSSTQALFTYTQNFDHGFFGTLYIPLNRVAVKDVQLLDCSPRDAIYPNQYTPEWQLFLQQFKSIMDRYNINIHPYTQTGLGDTTILAGWTKNRENTETLDYLDVTLQSGILLPTAKKTAITNPLDIPLGYNKHLGFPLVFTGSLGLFEWLTLGGHLNTLLFLGKKECIPLNTCSTQSGLITFTHDKAIVHKGPLLGLGSYFKIDHAGQALSLIIGYSYDRQMADSIMPSNPALFQQSLIDADPRYNGWSMHTMHFLAEYDFSKRDYRYGPRIGLTYNCIIEGKRIMKANTTGGFLGLEIQWDIP